MIETNGERDRDRESGKSVQAPRHDDNDIKYIICKHIFEDNILKWTWAYFLQVLLFNTNYSIQHYSFIWLKALQCYTNNSF